MTLVPSNLSTTLESDGRGLFTFTSTGQRFQGTSTNDGAMKIFRPSQRVIIEHSHRCVPVRSRGDVKVGTSFFAQPGGPLTHWLKNDYMGVFTDVISRQIRHDVFQGGTRISNECITDDGLGMICLLFQFKGVLENVRATPRP
jgi:hypothetical protein